MPGGQSASSDGEVSVYYETIKLAELQKLEAGRDEKFMDTGVFSSAGVRKIKINDPKLPFTDMQLDELPDLREEEESGSYRRAPAEVWRQSWSPRPLVRK